MPKFWIFRKCPKCGGDMHIEYDFYQCLQCGQTKEAPESVKRQEKKEGYDRIPSTQ